MTQFTQARFTVPPPKVSEAEWARIFTPKPKASKRKPQGTARGKSTGRDNVSITDRPSRG